jgi:hypothetical protein
LILGRERVLEDSPEESARRNHNHTAISVSAQQVEKKLQLFLIAERIEIS